MPKNILPMSIVWKLPVAAPIATMDWKTMTQKVRTTKAILIPIKSMIIPMKKGKTILGNAITVYNMLNYVYVMFSYFMSESWRAWGLLKEYMFANTTIARRKRTKNLIFPLL